MIINWFPEGGNQGVRGYVGGAGLIGAWVEGGITAELVATKLFKTPGRTTAFQTPGRDTLFKTPGRTMVFETPGK